ncbi:hypothetical protein Y046_3868 [Burkholderia pseudomallei MSHR2990]|nr:hypothetical protein Y046_3868 [Burkholderia pseudomallei MSHR2990]
MSSRSGGAPPRRPSGDETRLPVVFRGRDHSALVAVHAHRIRLAAGHVAAVEQVRRVERETPVAQLVVQRRVEQRVARHRERIVGRARRRAHVAHARADAEARERPGAPRPVGPQRRDLARPRHVDGPLVQRVVVRPDVLHVLIDVRGDHRQLARQVAHRAQLDAARAHLAHLHERAARRVVRIAHRDVRLVDLVDGRVQHQVLAGRLPAQARLDLAALGRRREPAARELQADLRIERRRIAEVRREPVVAEIREAHAPAERVVVLPEACRVRDVVLRRARPVLPAAEREHPAPPLDLVLHVQAECVQRRLRVGARVRVRPAEDVGRNRRVDGPVQVQARPLREPFAIGRRLAVVVEAEQQRVRKRARREFRLRLVVDVEAAVVELEQARVARHRRHRRVCVVEAAAVDGRVVERQVHPAHVLPQRPHRVQLVLELIAERPLLLAVMVEVRIGRVQVVRDRAVRIRQHGAARRQEVARRVAPVLQVRRGEGERGVRVRLPFERRRERHALVGERPRLRVAVAADADDPVRQRAVLADRVADVEHQLLARVVADLHAELADALAVRELALHVDDRAGIALPVQHRRRAAQHGDAVDHVRIDAPARQVDRVRHLQPVDEHGRREAAQRRVPVRTVVRPVAREARNVAERLIDVGRARRLDLLRGDDVDRLWNLDDRRIRFRARHAAPRDEADARVALRCSRHRDRGQRAARRGVCLRLAARLPRVRPRLRRLCLRMTRRRRVERHAGRDRTHARAGCPLHLPLLQVAKRPRGPHLHQRAMASRPSLTPLFSCRGRARPAAGSASSYSVVSAASASDAAISSARRASTDSSVSDSPWLSSQQPCR